MTTADPIQRPELYVVLEVPTIAALCMQPVSSSLIVIMSSVYTTSAVGNWWVTPLRCLWIWNVICKILRMKWHSQCT